MNATQELPRRLRIKAQKAGMEPEAYVADVVQRHPSFEAAAVELELSVETLRRWRRLTGNL